MDASELCEWIKTHLRLKVDREVVGVEDDTANHYFDEITIRLEVRENGMLADEPGWVVVSEEVVRVER